MKLFLLPPYARQVRKLLTNSERDDMERSLAADPLAHPVIPRTGGFRKARWGRGSRGKSGGVRTIYYYYVEGESIYLLYVYSKNEKENLTHEEENHLRRISDEIERHRI